MVSEDDQGFHFRSVVQLQTKMLMQMQKFSFHSLPQVSYTINIKRTEEGRYIYYPTKRRDLKRTVNEIFLLQRWSEKSPSSPIGTTQII